MITTRQRIELEGFFLIAMAAGVSLFLVVRSNYQPQLNVVLNTPIVPVTADFQSKITTSSQISPDGTKKVIMKITQNPDDTATYDFSTADENGENEKPVFTKTLDSSKSMAIPFNTWSPDNKYFFIMENAESDKNVFVFKATGEPLSDSEKYLDVTDIFKKNNTGNTFDEATGWASETLIIVNTVKQDNTKGPSYWFEVPSKAVIQLSTEF